MRDRERKKRDREKKKRDRERRKKEKNIKKMETEESMRERVREGESNRRIERERGRKRE